MALGTASANFLSESESLSAAPKPPRSCSFCSVAAITRAVFSAASCCTSSVFPLTWSRKCQPWTWAQLLAKTKSASAGCSGAANSSPAHGQGLAGSQTASARVLLPAAPLSTPPGNHSPCSSHREGWHCTSTNIAQCSVQGRALHQRPPSPARHERDDDTLKPTVSSKYTNNP